MVTPLFHQVGTAALHVIIRASFEDERQAQLTATTRAARATTPGATPRFAFFGHAGDGLRIAVGRDHFVVLISLERFATLPR
jgi:hypothetical protein